MEPIENKELYLCNYSQIFYNDPGALQGHCVLLLNLRAEKERERRNLTQKHCYCICLINTGGYRTHRVITSRGAKSCRLL